MNFLWKRKCAKFGRAKNIIHVSIFLIFRYSLLKVLLPAFLIWTSQSMMVISSRQKARAFVFARDLDRLPGTSPWIEYRVKSFKSCSQSVDIRKLTSMKLWKSTITLWDIRKVVRLRCFVCVHIWDYTWITIS